ncbi:MAG: hypothetical protein U9R14_04390, partial [Patescibacteria group bacterium]|nr:hypothetical protein [Patescibacteria group bacterium]
MKKGFNFKFSWGTILLLIVIIPVINLFLQMWEKDEGVIIWDIKSYYAYLPATIIYNDLSLEFMDEDPDFFGKWIWPIETPTGKRCIVTSMGLSFLYSPFFLTSHAYASLSSKYEANGYTVPYHVGLIFSAFFYFILGMYYLRKVLKRFFSENVTALTLFLVALGTNLFYYTTYEAPMAHCYSFALISIFFYFVIKWHDKKTI